jgi:hypothetical protein
MLSGLAMTAFGTFYDFITFVLKPSLARLRIQ